MTSGLVPRPPAGDPDRQVRTRRLPKLWNGERVSIGRGTLASLARSVPRFVRRPLEIPAVAPAIASPNPLHDAVIREAIGQRPEIAVGVVSRRYQLIQHQDVFAQIRAACTAMGWVPDRLPATLTLTEYGTRLHLVVHLPQELAFDPGDRHPVGLQLVALNAVDGSLALRIWLGYYRFVCANGLVVGSTLRGLRWRHIERNPFPDVGDVLREGLGIVRHDRRTFSRWRKRAVRRESLRAWVDGPLAAAWGVIAAARVWHIAEHGTDAELADRFAPGLPSDKPMRATVRVPGNPQRTATAWDVVQALSWVARHGGAPETAAEREAAVPRLVDVLCRSDRARRPRAGAPGAGRSETAAGPQGGSPPITRDPAGDARERLRAALAME